PTLHISTLSLHDALPISGDAPFILHEDGLGWIYVPKGLKDGPLPTHYEPLESPVSDELYSRETNPPEHWFPRRENQFAPPGDSRDRKSTRLNSSHVSISY